MNLYRDDDINKFTDIATFKAINDLFKKYGKIHTCAIEMEGLWESKGIWYLLTTEPNVEIGLHGWTHKDYSLLPIDEIVHDIERSLEYWRTKVARGFGADKVKPIKVFYPPWNKVSPNLINACAEFDLKVDATSGYQFHWWEFVNGDLLKLEMEFKK